MARLIAILGPTGSGKTVQAARLASEFGWVHLSTGDLLRQDPAMEAFLETGQLASSVQVNAIVAKALEAASPESSVVLDGFPRELSQAQWLDEWLKQHGRPPLHQVILLEINQPETAARLALRGRNDDTAKAQAAKWQAYETTTKPVFDYYRGLGLLTEIQALGSVAEVTQRIEEILL